MVVKIRSLNGSLVQNEACFTTFANTNGSARDFTWISPQARALAVLIVSVASLVVRDFQASQVLEVVDLVVSVDSVVAEVVVLRHKAISDFCKRKKVSSIDAPLSLPRKAHSSYLSPTSRPDLLTLITCNGRRLRSIARSLSRFSERLITMAN